MQIGIPFLIEFKSVEEAVQMASDLNVDFVELNLNFPLCQDLKVEELLQLSQKYNVFYTMHFYDNIDFGITDYDIRKGYIQSLEKIIIKYKDIFRVINIHIELGGVVTLPHKKEYINDLYYDNYYNALMDSLIGLNELADQNNIKLVLENVRFANYFDRLLPTLNQLGFKFTYDIGHDYKDHYKYYEYIKKFSLNVRHMHFHDASSKGDHLALGDGQIDLMDRIKFAEEHNLTVVIEVKTKQELVRSVKRMKELLGD